MISLCVKLACMSYTKGAGRPAHDWILPPVPPMKPQHLPRSMANPLLQSLVTQPILLLAWMLFSTSTSVAWQESQAKGKVNFQTEIRPILSNRCFACHGPDENTVEAGLRLDSFDGATSKSESGRSAIVPGNITESELLRRVSSQDDDIRMPPPHFGERLTSRETDLLQRWIASGANYAKHWSYETPRMPVVKTQASDWESRFPDWHESVIDRLVLRKLEEKGWEPSPRADKAT
ncbi:MAG: hypothetical protein FJ308_23305, partial [Planctomycetes bacterium]|nr:hypothetical protein [Planctomycetota bacterium]